MQCHIYLCNVQSDSSAVMLNSTHATTVRSLAVNTRTIALPNFQAQIVQRAGTNDNVHRLTTLPAFKCNPVKSCVTQKHAAKVTYGKTCLLVFDKIHIFCTTLHESTPVIRSSQALFKLSELDLGSMRIKRLRRARGYFLRYSTF
jgi:hypothetical protein